MCSCRDPCWLFLYILVAMGGIFVLIAAVEEGDVRYLMRGSDALGNLCGLPNQPNIPPNSSLGGVPWEDRTLVWYPVRLDGSISPSTSLRLGLCVSVCPVPECITLRDVPAGEVDQRTGKVVSATHADWTTHPNNPMRTA